MQELGAVLRQGHVFSPADVGHIAEQLAGLIRYGHDLGAVHGDITPETVQLDGGPGAWTVSLGQPRTAAAEDATGAEDVLGMGGVLAALSEGIPEEELPELWPVVISSMQAGNPADRPSIAQVEQYFRDDYPGQLAAVGGVGTAGAAGAAGAGAAGAAAVGAGAGSAYAAEPPYEPEPEMEATDSSRRGGGFLAGMLVTLLSLVVAAAAIWFFVLRPDGGGEAAESGPRDDGDLVAPSGPATAEPEEAEATTAPPTDEAAADEATDDEAEDAQESSGADRSGEATDEDASADNGDAAGADPWDGEEGAGGSIPGVPDEPVRSWNEAYCGSALEHLVVMAETESYRGVVCANEEWAYYIGMRWSDGARTVGLAEAAPPGSRVWEGVVDGVTYRISPDTFEIEEGGRILDSEPTTTFVIPSEGIGIEGRPGDLGLSEPIAYVPCTGHGAVVLYSDVAGAPDLEEKLEEHLALDPSVLYIRTDLSCQVFNPTAGGQPIYAAILPTDPDRDALCSAIEENDRYGYFLDLDAETGEPVSC